MEEPLSNLNRKVKKLSNFFGTSPLETTKKLRNNASKNAEDELLMFKGKSPSKNYLNRNDIIISIDKFKKDYNNLNSRKNNANFQKKFEEFKLKYPKLSKWRELSRKLENLRESGRAYFREHGEFNINNNNSRSNSNTNYTNTLEGKINGFNVEGILRKTPQPKKWYNLSRFTKKNTAKSYLPTQQNPQNNIRPASAVQSVPTATPSKSSWWPFGGGRKTHRKPSGSRGGNIYMSMDEASIHQKISNMQQEYPTKSEEDKIRLAREIQNARNALNAILTQEHNTLVREQNSRRIGGRKTHHKKRHMRKGSRKIHRK